MAKLFLSYLPCNIFKCLRPDSFRKSCDVRTRSFTFQSPIHLGRSASWTRVLLSHLFIFSQQLTYYQLKLWNVHWRNFFLQAQLVSLPASGSCERSTVWSKSTRWRQICSRKQSCKSPIFISSLSSTSNFLLSPLKPRFLALLKLDFSRTQQSISWGTIFLLP